MSAAVQVHAAVLPDKRHVRHRGVARHGRAGLPAGSRAARLQLQQSGTGGTQRDHRLVGLRELLPGSGVLESDSARHRPDLALRGLRRRLRARSSGIELRCWHAAQGGALSLPFDRSVMFGAGGTQDQKSCVPHPPLSMQKVKMLSERLPSFS